MKKIFTVEFWDAALSRMLRTICQAIVTSLASVVVIQDVNWALIGSTIAVMALSSLATSIMLSLPEVDG